jgi:hypothetical protein
MHEKIEELGATCLRLELQMHSCNGKPYRSSNVWAFSENSPSRNVT